MPIPPNQWEKLRQKSIDRGRDSTSENIEEPVVVKPLADSNKASAKLVVAPESTNGTAPARHAIVHVITTIRIPSRGPRGFTGLNPYNPPAIATNARMPVGTPNASQRSP